jgi:hypothetical protein
MDKGWASVACLFSVLAGWALGLWESDALTNQTAFATLVSAGVGAALVAVVAWLSAWLNRPTGGGTA